MRPQEKLQADLDKGRRKIIAMLQREYGVAVDDHLQGIIKERLKDVGIPKPLYDSDDVEDYLGIYEDTARTVIKTAQTFMNAGRASCEYDTPTESKSNKRGPYLESRRRLINLVSFVLYAKERGSRRRTQFDWEMITIQWNRSHGDYASKDNLEKSFHRGFKDPMVMLQLWATEQMEYSKQEVEDFDLTHRHMLPYTWPPETKEACRMAVLEQIRQRIKSGPEEGLSLRPRDFVDD
jgi:hypothetical protein